MIYSWRLLNDTFFLPEGRSISLPRWYEASLYSKAIDAGVTEDGRIIRGSASAEEDSLLNLLTEEEKVHYFGPWDIGDDFWQRWDGICSPIMALESMRLSITPEQFLTVKKVYNFRKPYMAKLILMAGLDDELASVSPKTVKSVFSISSHWDYQLNGDMEDRVVTIRNAFQRLRNIFLAESDIQDARVKVYSMAFQYTSIHDDTDYILNDYLYSTFIDQDIPSHMLEIIASHVDRLGLDFEQTYMITGMACRKFFSDTLMDDIDAQLFKLKTAEQADCLISYAEEMSDSAHSWRITFADDSSSTIQDLVECAANLVPAKWAKEMLQVDSPILAW